MEPELNPAQQERASCLPWMLAVIFVGAFIVLLSVATGGYFIYILGVAFFLGIIAGMHYALWGQRLDEQVGDERAEEKAREERIDEMREDENGGRYHR